MNIRKFIDQWIEASNSYDLEKYLTFYNEDAVLDDPSVGRKFVGIRAIREYFTSYFMDYKTQTRKIKLIEKDPKHAFLEVAFTGEFPEGKLGGTFDFTFSANKISHIKADLVQ